LSKIFHSPEDSLNASGAQNQTTIATAPTIITAHEFFASATLAAAED